MFAKPDIFFSILGSKTEKVENPWASLNQWHTAQHKGLKLKDFYLWFLLVERQFISLCVTFSPRELSFLSLALWNHPALFLTSIKSLHPPTPPLLLPPPPPCPVFRWPHAHKDRLTCLFNSIGKLNNFSNVVFYESAVLNEYSLER